MSEHKIESQPETEDNFCNISVRQDFYVDLLGVENIGTLPRRYAFFTTNCKKFSNRNTYLKELQNQKVSIQKIQTLLGATYLYLNYEYDLDGVFWEKFCKVIGEDYYEYLLSLDIKRQLLWHEPTHIDPNRLDSYFAETIGQIILLKLDNKNVGKLIYLQLRHYNHTIAKYLYALTPQQAHSLNEIILQYIRLP